MGRHGDGDGDVRRRQPARAVALRAGTPHGSGRAERVRTGAHEGNLDFTAFMDIHGICIFGPAVPSFFVCVLRWRVAGGEARSWG